MIAKTDVFASQWRDLREKVKQRWKALTDDDLEQIGGHVDVLVDLLQEKYGYSKALAEDAVNRFIRETSAEPVH